MFGDFHYVLFEQLVKSPLHEEFSVYACSNTAEETVCLVCSSGTTGLPKVVMLTHAGFTFEICTAG